MGEREREREREQACVSIDCLIMRELDVCKCNSFCSMVFSCDLLGPGLELSISDHGDYDANKQIF